MKKWLLFALAASCASATYAQHLYGVHRREDGTEFALKSVKTVSQVIGPLVRHKTIFTFKNPYKTRVEAVFDFGLDPGSALDGFAYWYKKERVRGILMDKRMAWYIYTAITSRNRDPGIMEMWSPTEFHAQIFPLAVGYDLRLELNTVGFVSSKGGKFFISRPEDEQGSTARHVWKVTGVKGHLTKSKTDDGVIASFRVPKSGKLDVQAVAQAGPYGRIYVAGIVRGRVNGGKPKIRGLRNLIIVEPDEDSATERDNDSAVRDSYMFVGWTKKLGTLTARQSRRVKTFKPRLLPAGRMCSKIWAANRLAHGDWENGKGVLAFSLKYQVPSSQTALLAVPRSERKLFLKKKTEFLRKLARQRREAKLSKGKKLNWNQNRGGDPQLQIEAPGARSVYALLPDGRVLNLRALGEGRWGTNFDVPTDAPEGAYQVKVVVVRRDGTTLEQTVTYKVNRTAPQGTAEFAVEQGRLVLRVRSQAELAEVAVYLADGRKIVLKEVSPCVYEAVLSEDASQFSGEILVVLKDRASNKTELRCAWPSR